MKFIVSTSSQNDKKVHELVIIPAFKSKSKKAINISDWDASYKKAFSKIKASKFFEGAKGQTFSFPLENGATVLALGLGEKESVSLETLRWPSPTGLAPLNQVFYVQSGIARPTTDSPRKDERRSTCRW